MKIFRFIEEVPFNVDSIITIGTFDGLHLAHKKIIDEVVIQARKKRYRSVVVTFDPHPREVVLTSGSDIKLLTTIQERQELCEKYGVDIFIILEFNEAFSRQSFRDFYIKYIINGIGVRMVIEGYNHHWGKNREGNIRLLTNIGKEFGFEFVPVDPIEINSITINSSLIRKILYEGNVAEASMLLGRPYRLFGKVVSGEGRGKKLGYPTANIELESKKKLVPKNGIYFVQVHLEEDTYYGITSIGIRPTFKTDGNRTIEVYILDYNKDIYGNNMKIDFLDRLRDELKFNTTERLIQQMDKDKELSYKLRNEHLKIENLGKN